MRTVALIFLALGTRLVGRRVGFFAGEEGKWMKGRVRK
jgi:hypothetical protein